MGVKNKGGKKDSSEYNMLISSIKSDIKPLVNYYFLPEMT
jgi:hypothetical protein